MNILNFVYILVLNIKIRTSLAFYNAPTFIQQNNISVPITLSGYDPCRLFQIRNQTLYRMGQSNIISSWNLSSLSNIQQILYQTLNWSVNILNLGIGYQTNQTIATLITTPGTKKFNVLDSSTLQFTSSYVNTWISSYTLIKVIPTKLHYIQLFSSNTFNNTIFIYDKNMVFLQNLTLNILGPMNATISEDESAMIVWDLQGMALFVQYNGTSWGCNIVSKATITNPAMNSVTISKNGSLVLLEYDSQYYFYIVNFRTPAIISRILFNNTTINQAVFLDQDCHLIALTINYNTIQIYDTLTLTLQSTSYFNVISNYSVVDYSSGTLYFCLQKNIQTFKIKCPRLAYRSTTTNQCLNCSVDINCYECDQDTGLCISCDVNFTLNSSFSCLPVIFSVNTSTSTNATNSSSTINTTNSTNNNATNSTILNPNQNTKANTISPMQALIVNITLEGFQVINPVIKSIFQIIQMSPFTLIFLSFMNYWNLCCLYSILQVKVPMYLPQIHQKIFQAIQSSIFIDLGFNPTLQSLNYQNVSSTYYMIDYSIELDFINPNIQNVLMILFVLLLILTTICFRNFFLKKSSLLYKLLKINTVQSLIGQFISLVPFCILPYRFLINEAYFINFDQKLNLILQVLLLIICFLASCVFIWSRSNTYIENQIKKSQCFKQISRNQMKSKILMQKVKSKDKKTQNQNLKELQMLVINISVPLLIILPTYFPFFIVNLGIFFYGIKKASKSTEYRINNIISACYLPIYHSCYIFFYLFGQIEFVYNYIGLFCLVILFLGGLHELCNVILITLYEFIKWLIKTIKQQCISKKQQQNKSLKSRIENIKQVSCKFQPSNINCRNFGAINKVANSYNQKQQTKIKKSFKSKNVNRVNQQIDSIVEEDFIKNRVKVIKFKAQKTYQRGLEINQTMKPSIIKSFKKHADNVVETSEILKQQNLSSIKKKYQNSYKNYKIHQNFQQVDGNCNKELDKFNQMLKKDRILRKLKSGKILSNYKVL